MSPEQPDPFVVAKWEVRHLDALFLTPTWAVDLLAMSNTISEEAFRYYVNCSRFLRAWGIKSAKSLSGSQP